LARKPPGVANIRGRPDANTKKSPHANVGARAAGLGLVISGGGSDHAAG
jgi:hypothetical protein